MSKDRLFITIIYLLMEERRCLRSVLSEYAAEHNEYVQWIRAEILREAIETLEFKL